MTADQAAAKVLHDWKGDSVGCGDEELLHEIADRLGMPHEARLTSRKVLKRIDCSHRGVALTRRLN